MRRLLTALPVGLLMTACTATPAAEATASGSPTPTACTASPTPGTTTPEDFLGWLAAHPDDASLVLDDGDRVEHLGDRARPLASARKVVHLAAWATLVEDGRLAPDASVPVGRWERWYLPGTDGGAHVAALTRLGIATDGVRATDPATPVLVSDVVSAMVQESDNAAPDLLRELLGPEVLAATAADLGWDGAPTGSFLGDLLRVLEPGVDPETAAQRYVDDPAEAARVQALPLPDPAAQTTWAADSVAGTAEGLAAVHAAIGAGALPAARAQLEWQGPPEGYAGLGFKGGSLPGVLTEAIALRTADGEVTVGVLLVEGMAVGEWAGALTSGLPQQQVLLAAMTDPDARAQLECALR
ncbi:Beta-lactamase enzyme family protein [Klenkia marina]|uniref:Beta-lactamase enzyme family protein n=1 Tax=Klenkia marina TaxID=1960309 RepID=A0A1G4YZ26_9ACTN|nr:serine hydrolase [Klenkia marina]SCX58680.1 Beta-lactamase enzyme family protein [Klenkia marina]